MRIITESELDAWLATNRWTRSAFGTFRPVSASIEYQTTYESGGTVGAEMADLFLNEFLERRICGGLLYVYRIFPFDEPSIRFFQHLLELYGAPGVEPKDFRVEFVDEYDRVFASIAWCLACNWEFSFIAAGRQIALSTDEDEGFRVRWGKDERLKHTVPELLRNLEFRATNSEA